MAQHNLLCSALRRVLTFGFVLALGAMTTARSQAQQQSFSFFNSGDFDNVHVTLNGTNDYVEAGRYQGSLSQSTGGQKVYIFCTDAMHWQTVNPYQTLANLGSVSGPLATSLTNVGGDYYYTTGTPANKGAGMASAIFNSADYQVTSVTQAQAQQRSSAVAWLTQTYLNQTAGYFATNVSGNTKLSDNMAAIQIAIWKITEDGFNASLLTEANYSSYLGAGLVRWLDANNVGVTFDHKLLNYYLNLASSQTAFTGSANWIQAPRSNSLGSHTFGNGSSQDFAYVPEPAFVQLAALLGMGGATLLRVRRRTRPCAAA